MPASQLVVDHCNTVPVCCLHRHLQVKLLLFICFQPLISYPNFNLLDHSSHILFQRDKLQQDVDELCFREGFFSMMMMMICVYPSLHPGTKTQTPVSAPSGCIWPRNTSNHSPCLYLQVGAEKRFSHLFIQP